MEKFLNLFLVIVSVFLILTVLLQQRGTTLGGAFGGESAVYFARRGAEKFLFILTIILAVLFTGGGILRLIL